LAERSNGDFHPGNLAGEARDPQLSFDLFSAGHAVAKGKEPFDARPLCRDAGFSQQVPPVIWCKGSCDRNGLIMPRHAVHGQKPCGIFMKK
jgi:hypothetical protein